MCNVQLRGTVLTNGAKSPLVAAQGTPILPYSQVTPAGIFLPGMGVPLELKSVQSRVPAFGMWIVMLASFCMAALVPSSVHSQVRSDHSVQCHL